MISSFVVFLAISTKSEKDPANEGLNNDAFSPKAPQLENLFDTISFLIVNLIKMCVNNLLLGDA